MLPQSIFSQKDNLNTVVTEELRVDTCLELSKRIDLITHDVSRPYFNTILKKLAVQNFENASIICDYIITEQTEMNIKQSTKEGKIKVLVWLSNHNSHKSLKDFTKNDILSYMNAIRKSTIKDPTQMDRYVQWATDDFAQVLPLAL